MLARHYSVRVHLYQLREAWESPSLTESNFERMVDFESTISATFLGVSPKIVKTITCMHSRGTSRTRSDTTGLSALNRYQET